MATGIDNVVLVLLRGGVIPILCGSATCCFAIYSAKVSSAAKQWRLLELPAFDRARCTAHAAELDKHAGACAALTLASAATTAEAIADHCTYRSKPPDQLGGFFASRWPFFARPTVLVTAAASVLVSISLSGGVRFLAPPRPPVRIISATDVTRRPPATDGPRADEGGGGGTSTLPAVTSARGQAPWAAEHQLHEAAAAAVVVQTQPAQTAAVSAVAQPSTARVRWPQSASPSAVQGGGPSGYELMCEALAKRLEACEASNTPKTRFHCDPQRERWRAACARPNAQMEAQGG